MNPEKVTIDEKGHEKMKELEKWRETELQSLNDAHKKTKDEILTASSSEGKLDKLKFWKDTKTETVEDPIYWALVNVEGLKEFVKYGANKVLDQIRIRTAANIEAREAIARAKDEKKREWDIKTITMTLLILAIVGSISFVIVNNFLNYNVVAGENVQLKIQIGDVSGNLAACRSELDYYNPAAVLALPAAGGEPDNVLEG